MKGKIFSVNISKIKGIAKTPVAQVLLIEGYGLESDAHAGGDPLKQVSLLSIESIKKQEECDRAGKSVFGLSAGDFAENITTENIDLVSLRVGDKLKIGNEVLLEISKVGKDCHKRCAIYYKLSDCIMPREGIFAKIIRGGKVGVGDSVVSLRGL